jgi:segregation and condensation protein A
LSQREAVTVRLESFEGPLDLLLYLIQSHELDISTVSGGKITDLNITDLGLGYQDMLVRARKRTTILRKETVSVAERIGYFADRLEVGRPAGLQSLLSAMPTRPEEVVTFLASLELSRLKKLKLFQERTYDEIYLELLENIKGMALGISTEFDLPNGGKISLEQAVSEGTP